MKRLNNTIIPGLLLIIVGLFIFVYQWLGWSFSWLSWPFFIILPGIFVIILSLLVEGNTGEGLTIFGFILTTIGGILYFQWKTNHWETWAYLWALIPLSVGLAQMLHSLVYTNHHKLREGLQTFQTGLILFICFTAGFELLLFRRNYFFQPFGFAILMILAGLLIIFRKTRTKRQLPNAIHQPKEGMNKEETISDDMKNE